MVFRRLLMLGSNLPDDSRLCAALHRLAAHGRAELLGDIQHLPPRSGGGAWYFNALAVVESVLDDAAFRALLADIERELGRDRSQPARVEIDIDLLARQCDGDWVADAHALAKRELEQPPAVDLMRASGILVRSHR